MANTGYIIYYRINVLDSSGNHVSGSPVLITDSDATATDIKNAVIAVTGKAMSDEKAQSLVDARKVASSLCDVCSEPLVANHFYAEYHTSDNVMYKVADGSLYCKQYKVA